MRLSEEQITEVRNKADIADIIGRYIPIIKKGKNLSAVCPFHDDHNPSLSISTDKQIYKCFVCGNGGNVFTFVQNIEKISFVEAVLKVAEYCGIDLGVRKDDLANSRFDETTRGYFKLLKEAVAFQQYQLNSSGGALAKEYLQQRGYDDDTLTYFGIGYNPPKDALYRFLKAKGYDVKDMTALNVIRDHDGEWQDVFADRVTFPIYERYGNPIAFSARTIIPGYEPKYINTSGTKLYVKGNVLYNYHNAQEAVRHEHAVIVVEGVTDVIALYKAGYKNVVATLGTAMSQAQMTLLEQLSRNIILCYDGDAAGQAANYKNGQLLNARKNVVRVINNDTKADPDEILRQNGAEYLRKMITEPAMWIEYVISYLLTRYDLDNYLQKKNFSKETMSEIMKLNDSFDRESFIRRLSEMTQFDGTQLRSLAARVNPPAADPQAAPPIKRSEHLSGRQRAEYEILAQMLNSNEACGYFKTDIGFLPDDINNRLAMLILDYKRRNPDIGVADIISFVEDDKLKDLIMNISEWEFLNKDFDRQVLADAYVKIKISLIDDKLAAIRRKQKLTTDPQLKQRLADELVTLKKEKISLQENGSREVL